MVVNNSKEPQGLRSDGTPYRVLIVDDSIFIAKQLSQILSSEGFEIIDTASDGDEGVEKYKKLHPKVDLVTMDVTMPKLDGLSALQRILDFDKDAQIIMVSALGKNDLVKNALITGAKNFIVKPLDRDKVLERVLATIQRL